MYNRPAIGAAAGVSLARAQASVTPGTSGEAPPGSSAQHAGTQVLNSMHDAMTRFARVSTLIDDVLRHLHMLFDAVFGLGYSVGAVREEARMWLAVKSGPVALIWRALRTALSVWRVLCIFFMSPMAGRYSPVALVLRILGLVPEEEEKEEEDVGAVSWSGL